MPPIMRLSKFLLKMLPRKKYKPKFNYDRYSLWVACSLGWLGEDPTGSLMTRLQGLGIVDAELYDINKFDIDKCLDHDLTVFDHVNIKSYLWVLGVYEFFRMYDQKLREKPELADEKATEYINKAKKELSRIRVPLAKLEPSNKFKNIDYAIPRLGGDEIQLGWSINDNEVIWYRDLSNLAIDALNQMRISRINRNLNNES